MAGFEQTIIIGNVGRDPEVRFLPSGAQVCTFTVAVSRRWKDRQTNEQKEATTWYKVNCWNNLGEIAKNYVRKGSQVMVTGTVTASAYMGQDGQPRSSLDLRAENFQMLGSRNDNMGSSSEGGTGGYDYDVPPPNSVDDIPF
jgi:single-strand DNA-binding protein